MSAKDPKETKQKEQEAPTQEPFVERFSSLISLQLHLLLTDRINGQEARKTVREFLDEAYKKEPEVFKLTDLRYKVDYLKLASEALGQEVKLALVDIQNRTR